MEQKAIHILIVEDDIIIATHISKILSKAQFEIDGILPSGEAALKHIENNQPDIIILDIALKGKIDGIETAQYVLDHYRIPVIYLTANADEPTFARAKKTKPEAFISKPFKSKHLLRTIDLVISRMEDKVPVKAALKDGTDSAVFLDDRIFIRDKERMVKVYLRDILYIEAERNYCRVHTKKKHHLLSIPLKTFEKRLSSDIFMRVHRSFLVNLSQIDELDEYFIFIQKKSIPISKSYKEALNNRLKLM